MICRVQRGRIRIALADIDKFNERAHYCSRFAARSASPTGRRLQNREIKNAKQARVVGPDFLKLQSGTTSQRGEPFRRVLVGIFGENFFAGGEFELPISDANGLGRLADQIHFDAALIRIVNGSMSPVSYIEIGAELTIGTIE